MRQKRQGAAMAKKAVPEFKLGDYVRILHSGYDYARIVELRGPLGPGGAPVYDVRIYGTQVPMHAELLGDEMELIPADELIPLREKVALREAKLRELTGDE